jgi:excisionase family DNA binding protein
MNLKAASRTLGVHYQTAYRWVRAGDLPAVRIGNRYDVSDAAIEQFTATRRSLTLGPISRPCHPTEHSCSRDVALDHLAAMATAPVLSCASIVEVAARLGREVLGDACAVVVANDDRRHVDHASVAHEQWDHAAFLRAVLGLATSPAVLDRSFASSPYFDGRPVRVAHVAQDSLRRALAPDLLQHLDRYGVHSVVSAPITVTGPTAGFVACTRDTPTQPYTAADEAFLARLAAQVGRLVGFARETTEAARVRTEIAEQLHAVLLAGCYGAPPTAEAVRRALDPRWRRSPWLITVLDAHGRRLVANDAAADAPDPWADELAGRSVAPTEPAGELPMCERLRSGEIRFADTYVRHCGADGSESMLAWHRAAVRALDATLGCIVNIGHPVPDLARSRPADVAA